VLGLQWPSRVADEIGRAAGHRRSSVPTSTRQACGTHRRWTPIVHAWRSTSEGTLSRLIRASTRLLATRSSRSWYIAQPRASTIE